MEQVNLNAQYKHSQRYVHIRSIRRRAGEMVQSVHYAGWSGLRWLIHCDTVGGDLMVGGDGVKSSTPSPEMYDKEV